MHHQLNTKLNTIIALNIDLLNRLNVARISAKVLLETLTISKIRMLLHINILVNMAMPF